MKESEVPANIKTNEDANRFCRLKEAEFESARLRLENKMAWQRKYYNFNELIKLFEERRKITAPNSYRSDLYLLTQYVLPFFLNVKECNNLNNWNLFFEDFRDWLMKVKPIKQKVENGTLAYSTMNGAIKALNAFLEAMFQKKQVGEVRKMKLFPSHLLNKKTFEDVLSPTDIEAIHKALTTFDQNSADMFYVSLHTGMREGELLGLSLNDVFQGEPKEKILSEALKKHGLKAVGYIVLESQIANNIQIRESNGVVKRKPLKSRKTIEPANSRTIPILDKKAFNLLVAKWKTQNELFKAKKFGPDRRNYLLFDGLNKNIYYNSFAKAREKTGRLRFSPHSSRGTYSTNLCGRTQGDMLLAQIILGHSPKHAEVTLRYVHIYEQIQKEIKAQKQTINGLEFVE